MGGKWFSKQYIIEYLTWEEEQVIIGSLLGDGSLNISKSGETVRFVEGHTMVQKEYLLWKCERLERLGVKYFESPNRPYRIGPYRGTYIATRLRTPYLAELQKYQDLFYINGVKVITNEMLGYIQDLALAVWFMDDGSLRRCGRNGKYRRLRLMTQSFNQEENIKLLEALGLRFGITGHVMKKPLRRGGRQNYSLELSAEGSKRFAALIKPFIHPMMEYKLEGL